MLSLFLCFSRLQTVPFLSKIDPKGKNVEMWMNEVESGMKAAFKQVRQFLWVYRSAVVTESGGK